MYACGDRKAQYRLTSLLLVHPLESRPLICALGCSSGFQRLSRKPQQICQIIAALQDRYRPSRWGQQTVDTDQTRFLDIYPLFKFWGIETQRSQSACPMLETCLAEQKEGGRLGEIRLYFDRCNKYGQISYDFSNSFHTWVAHIEFWDYLLLLCCLCGLLRLSGGSRSSLLGWWRDCENCFG